MLHDDSEASLRSAIDPVESARQDQALPGWDEVIFHLEAASGDELAEDRNSHSNSAWARLVTALVELQRGQASKPD